MISHHARWIALLFVSSTLGSFAATGATGDKAVRLFHGTNLIRISIELPDAGLQLLRGGRLGRNTQEKVQAEATVSENGRTYTNVTVQLKGVTSFQPIDRFPSLTLNFHKLSPGQKFHGLTKISLNNSVWDTTFLNEKLSREMYAAADVPVPRADYALVILNGHELGLYVVTEGFDKEFLKRHFQETDGNLYEGSVLQDIDRPLALQVNSGKNPTNHTALQKLLNAAREPDAEKRFAALASAMDMEKFLSMVAVETILCHSDSYSMNRNNYRLYHDPVTDKMVFLPHGMDRVLGTHRSTIDLSLMPPTLGLVARALLTTTEGRRRYLDRAGVVFTNLFQPDVLNRRVREIDAEILAAKLGLPADRRFSDRPDANHARDAETVGWRITQRGAELRAQLAHVEELLAPTPRPNFDTNGTASLPDWRPARRPDQPGTVSAPLVQDGKNLLRVKTTNAPLANGTFAFSLRNRVSLPAGDYQLTGRIGGAGTNAAPTSGALLRQWTDRFGVERQRLDWRQVNFRFRVFDARGYEELEFVCDIQSDAPEITLDASSLRLTRLQGR